MMAAWGLCWPGAQAVKRTAATEDFRYPDSPRRGVTHNGIAKGSHDQEV